MKVNNAFKNADWKFKTKKLKEIILADYVVCLDRSSIFRATYF